jgi:predicted acylesterase/phospholipase RssA
MPDKIKAGKPTEHLSTFLNEDAGEPSILAQTPTATKTKLELIEEARSVLRGKYVDSGFLKKLGRELERNDQFAYATEVLLRKMHLDKEKGIPTPLTEFQSLAKYIYKDHSLPSSFKFERALEELNSHDELSKTDNCETLGLAGAIYKRIWQYDHQFKNLILSRYYYEKGYHIWKNYISTHDKPIACDQNDDGYTAINYAYICELMAVDKLEEHGKVTGVSEGIEARYRDANNVRRFILDQFLLNPSDEKPDLKVPLTKWIVATIAESFFGLRKYGRALRFISDFARLAEPWEMRTFSQQLFSIAYLQTFLKNFVEGNPGIQLPADSILFSYAKEISIEEIATCLHTATPSSPGTAEKSAIIKKAGKLGLALSGGGFRASIFHIGVLAALAENDQLKEVEAISCVSGGSIIGAFYYLKLKQLLETKKDKDIKQQDYIKIVQEIEIEFLEGVQKNLRMRIFTNPVSSFKMMFSKNYSRTNRLGELYEKHLYDKIFRKKTGPTGPQDRKIYMTDLIIQPMDHPDFNISIDNWKRVNKIPQLILNATTLNTGHNWQFTASWMGEPPGSIQADIDVKPRLRRMYYSEAPDEYKNFRLGYAVGASSCVPVMFQPMPMHNLYPEIDLQLVDGGLHDNQGVGALIEQECKQMIISDASGQLPTNTTATGNGASLFYRSDNIVQERVRELQFRDIKERNHTTQLERLVTIHLKQGLQKYPLKWRNCDDPTRKILYTNVADENQDLTDYGILRNVQSMLSEIRTDLDSFNDIEAYALMYSAYCLVNDELNKIDDKKKDAVKGDWRFLAIRGYVTKNEQSEKIRKYLLAGKSLAFKLLKVSTPAKIISIALGVLVFAVLAYLVWTYPQHELYKVQITVKGLAYLAGVFVLGFFVKWLADIINIRSIIKKKVIFFFIMIAGIVICNFYIWFLNGLYNKAGKIKKQA